MKKNDHINVRKRHEEDVRNNRYDDEPSSKRAHRRPAERNNEETRLNTVSRRYVDKDERKTPRINISKRYTGVDDEEPRTARLSKRYTGVDEERSRAARINKRPAGKNDEEVRLNRYIANAGICSRREADDLIASGMISVNGNIVTTLGAKVGKNDKVVYKGQALNPEKKVYLLLNKPRGYVTTLDDQYADHTVMELIRNACEERVYPVGRLDKYTTGVLLFTNDGILTKKLTHPRSEQKKIYHVFLNSVFTIEHMEQLRKGITLEDGFIAPDAVDYSDINDKSQVGIEIHSGRNRIVRRMFEHFGYKISKLDRVYFAGLTKKNLPRGRWRLLTPQEISFLKMNK